MACDVSPVAMFMFMLQTLSLLVIFCRASNKGRSREKSSGLPFNNPDDHQSYLEASDNLNSLKPLLTNFCQNEIVSQPGTSSSPLPTMSARLKVNSNSLDDNCF